MKKKTSLKISRQLIFATIFLSLSLVFLIFLLIIQLIPAFSNQKYSEAAFVPSVKQISNNKVGRKDKKTEKAVTPEAKKSISSNFIPVTAGYQVRLPILMYHYIGNNPNPTDHQRDILSITPDKFETQMKYLADNGYTTTSLDTLYAALKKQITLPNKTIALTFDDGYIDFYYNAYPILKRFNLTATVFVPTGLVGRPAYLTWSQIKEMNSTGLIHFAAHSVHHYNLPSLSDESVLYELRASKQELEKELGIPINFMAYPYGAADERVIRLAQSAGYVGSAGTWPSQLQSEGTIYNIPRLRIFGSMDLDTFISKL